jgi:hypothetical protein
MTKLAGMSEEEKYQHKLQQVRDYYKKHKERLLERQKYLRQNSIPHRNRYLKYLKNYYRTDVGKKKNVICSWKKIGIICYDWDTMYDVYLDSLDCDYCKKPFQASNDKHLDHDHNITDRQNIRGILCRSCNLRDKLKDYEL